MTITYDIEMLNFGSYILVVYTRSLDILASLIENDIVLEAN